MGTQKKRSAQPKPPSTRQRKRAGEAVTEPQEQADDQDKTAFALALVPVDESGNLPDIAKPVRGVMALLDGEQIIVVSVNVHDLMVGDILSNAQKAHRSKFE